MCDFGGVIDFQWDFTWAEKRVRAIRFFFSQLKTEKTEMGYTFLTAADT